MIEGSRSVPLTNGSGSGSRRAKNLRIWRFCLMIEGSGSVPLTNGSGSGSRRTKNLWIWRARGFWITRKSLPQEKHQRPERRDSRHRKCRTPSGSAARELCTGTLRERTHTRPIMIRTFQRFSFTSPMVWSGPFLNLTNILCFEQLSPKSLGGSSWNFEN